MPGEELWAWGTCERRSWSNFTKVGGIFCFGRFTVVALGCFVVLTADVRLPELAVDFSAAKGAVQPSPLADK